MEKLIFRKFFLDILNFFLIATVSLSLIVWVIQAVNYLDFVSEDGHSFKVYFIYTLLSFPKIISRLMIFVFFISIFYTILRYQEKNELIIFWSNGIRKLGFFNFIVKCSFILVIIQLFLTLFVVPKSQDLARSYIRTSNVDYFPSLLKSKRFVSTLEDLTIFVDKKNDNGELINIFLKDKKELNSSQIITAKKGVFKKSRNTFYLVLEDGNIIDLSEKGSTIISYDKTNINLSNYATKTTVDPKIQEQPSKLLFSCIFSIYMNNLEFKDRNLDCNRNTVGIALEEIYKRIILPFYIIILSIVASCLALKSEYKNYFSLYKLFVFFIGVIVIAFSQASANYSSVLNFGNIMLIVTPFLISVLFYFYMQFQFKD